MRLLTNLFYQESDKNLWEASDKPSCREKQVAGISGEFDPQLLTMPDFNGKVSGY